MSGEGNDSTETIDLPPDYESPPSYDEINQRSERGVGEGVKKDWNIFLAKFYTTIYTFWLMWTIVSYVWEPEISTLANFLEDVFEFWGIFVICNDDIKDVPNILVLFYTYAQLVASSNLIIGLQTKSFRRLDRWMLFTIHITICYSLKVWHLWRNNFDGAGSAIFLISKVVSFYAVNAFSIWRIYDCRDVIWSKATPPELLMEFETFCSTEKRFLDLVALVHSIVLIIYADRRYNRGRLYFPIEVGRIFGVISLVSVLLNILLLVIVRFSQDRTKKTFIMGWFGYHLILTGAIYSLEIENILFGMKSGDLIDDIVITIICCSFPWLLLVWANLSKLQALNIQLQDTAVSPVGDE